MSITENEPELPAWEKAEDIIKYGVLKIRREKPGGDVYILEAWRDNSFIASVSLKDPRGIKEGVDALLKEVKAKLPASPIKKKLTNER